MSIMEKRKVKRVVSIQDISCFGKCSLTVAIPVMSVMEIETAVIPTAVLSTHTGSGFEGYTYHDLSDDILPIAEHWKKYNLKFDAVCTGYLGSIDQINIMKKFFEIFGKDDTVIFVDPVMGDNGKMYAGFTMEFVEKMKGLCACADVITPNITEASLLLGDEYKDKGYNKEDIEKVLKRLANLGAKKIILTGICFSQNEQGTAFYDSTNGSMGFYMTENIPGIFHGTGDLFSAAAAGMLVNGGSIESACKTAADFVVESIKATLPEKEKYWYGVSFEKALPMLIERVKNI